MKNIQKMIDKIEKKQLELCKIDYTTVSKARVIRLEIQKDNLAEEKRILEEQLKEVKNE